jgi:hypothetical protein
MNAAPHIMPSKAGVHLAGKTHTKCPNDRLAGDTHLVMPAKAGIHDLLLSLQRKSWIPAGACPLRRRGAGMTRNAQRQWVNGLVGWYDRRKFQMRLPSPAAFAAGCRGTANNQSTSEPRQVHTEFH